MKNTIFLFVASALIVLFLHSCNPCKNYDCTTPPQQLSFVIEAPYDVDSTTVDIKNIRTKKSLKIGLRNGHYVSAEIGWQEGANNKNYTLQVNGSVYSFVYHTESKSVDCCDIIGDLVEFSSDDFHIEKIMSKGIYKLSIK